MNTIVIIPPSVRTPAAPQEIEYIASYATGVGTSPITLTKPTGTVEGDLLVVNIIYDDPRDWVTPPTGWTATISNGDGGVLRSYVFTKIAGASEPASYDFTFLGTKNTAAVIAAFRGVYSTPIGNKSTAYGNDTFNPIELVSTSINIQSGGNWGIICAGHGYGTTLTGPAGWTEIGQAYSWTGNTHRTAGMWYKAFDSSGAVGNQTVTAPNGAAGYWYASQVEIRIT
jgi:hypothetical protein